MGIAELADAVETREDFARFLHYLAEKSRSHGGKWENSDLASFLEGASGWTQDMDGFFLNIGQPVPKEPSWGLFAKILAAACYYE
ncbi:MAG: hypothetical protein WC943_11845 [Elusimicrobiota bacterium]|jgi:hypothetical protein